MKRGRKKKVIVPETLEQYIEERSRKSPKFRKAYEAQVSKLNIAHQIMLLRKQMKISQAQLARRMGTTQQTVSRLEDPKNAQITVSTLSRAAIALRARLSVDFIPERR